MAGLGVKKSGCQTWLSQCVVFLGKKHFFLTVLLSTQEYKRVLAICQGCLMKCLGGNLGIDWHPIGGGERVGSKTPSCFMPRKPR